MTSLMKLNYNYIRHVKITKLKRFKEAMEDVYWNLISADAEK